MGREREFWGLFVTAAKLAYSTKISFIFPKDLYDAVYLGLKSPPLEGSGNELRDSKAVECAGILSRALYLSCC